MKCLVGSSLSQGPSIGWLSMSCKNTTDYGNGYQDVARNKAGWDAVNHCLQSLVMRANVKIISKAPQNQTSVRKVIARYAVVKNDTGN